MKHNELHKNTRKTTIDSRRETEAVLNDVDASLVIIKKEIKKDIKNYSKTGDIKRRVT